MPDIVDGDGDVYYDGPGVQVVGDLPGFEVDAWCAIVSNSTGDRFEARSFILIEKELQNSSPELKLDYTLHFRVVSVFLTPFLVSISQKRWYKHGSCQQSKHESQVASP